MSTTQDTLPIPDLATRQMEIVRRTLIEEADTRLAQYPQYRNYHDDWIVVRVSQVCRFKGTAVLYPGVYYLAAPRAEMRIGDMAGWSVYDHATGHHVSCPPEHLTRKF